MQSKDYIKVKMDINGIILDFESTFEDMPHKKEEVLGKNWFDIFISESDKQKVLEVFRTIIKDGTKEFKTYNNDIKCPNGSHIYMDFTNTVFIQNTQKVVESLGIEHYKNQQEPGL